MKKLLPIILTLTLTACDPQGRKKVQDTALNVALTVATMTIYREARK